MSTPVTPPLPTRTNGTCYDCHTRVGPGCRWSSSEDSSVRVFTSGLLRTLGPCLRSPSFVSFRVSLSSSCLLPVGVQFLSTNTKWQGRTIFRLGECACRTVLGPEDVVTRFALYVDGERVVTVRAVDEKLHELWEGTPNSM